MNPKCNALMHEVLMCSVFVDPLDPGLTKAEITEICSQAGFQNGEINDTFPHVSKETFGRARYIANKNNIRFSEVYEASDPALINIEAADYVLEALNDRIRADGVKQARLDRKVIVDRAVAEGYQRTDVEGAILCLSLAETFVLTDDVLSLASGVTGPRRLLGGEHRYPASRTNELRPQALDLVRDVVARRTDGRPQQSEPLDAFSEALERMGFRPFRIWWTQTVTELRRSDPHSTPVSCVVLSAALVEGALTFAAKHSRDGQIGAFQSSNFDGDPRTWKAEKLIESVAMGGPAAIFTPQIKARAEHLNRTRQRVHAGRMLAEYPGGPPDLRPEEGRDAKATAELVVRAVLDWLAKAPSAG